MCHEYMLDKNNSTRRNHLHEKNAPDNSEFTVQSSYRLNKYEYEEVMANSFAFANTCLRPKY